MFKNFKMFRFISILTIFAIFFFFSSCRKLHKQDEDAKQTPRDDLIEETEKTKGKFIFPHTENFKKTKVHGDRYNTFKEDGLCELCHGVDLLGGKSKISCRKCHGHTKEFLDYASDPNLAPDKSFHEATLFENLNNCIVCHNRDENTLTKKRVCKSAINLKNTNIDSCNKCHDYPHSNTWASSEKHGENFIKEWERNNASIYGAKDKPSCLDCHAKNSSIRQKNASTFAPECKSCHSIDVPHTKVFLDPEHHSTHKILATTFLKECMICHLGKEKMQKGIQYISAFQRLMRPEKLNYGETSDCASCHEKEKIKDNNLTKKAYLEKAKTQHANCYLCHKNKNLSLHMRAGSGSKLLHSCSANGACHNPNKKPVLKHKIEWKLK